MYLQAMNDKRILGALCLLVATVWGAQAHASESKQITIDTVVDEFREPNARLTVFEQQDDPARVERERHGPGWRMFHGGDGTERRVILYNH